MKYHGDRKYLHWGITAVCVICSCILFYYILFHGSRLGAMIHRFFGICFPIMVGFILAYLFTPVVNSIEYRFLNPLHKKITKNDKWKHKSLIRILSILIAYTIIFLCFTGLFALIIPELANSISNIGEQFPQAFDKYYKRAVDYLNKNQKVAEFLKNNFSFDLSAIDSKEVTKWLISHIENIGFFLSTITNTIYSTLKTTLNLIIGLIVSVYLIYGKETYAAQAKKICYSVFEMHNANRLIKDCRFIHKTFIGFISGKIVDSIIIGILCFIGVAIIGLHYPVLISVIVGVTNIIPFFGPYLGAIPCALLLLLIDPIEALIFLIFIFVLQQLDGNVIGPSILGSSTGISSFWVIFAITFFGGIYGIMGMVIGVPVFAVIYAFTKRFVNRKLTAKHLPTDTNLYRDAYEIRNGEFIKKEHLFTEIKNPDKPETDTEKYHLFRSLISKFQGHDENQKPENHNTEESKTDTAKPEEQSETKARQSQSALQKQTQDQTETENPDNSNKDQT